MHSHCIAHRTLCFAAFCGLYSLYNAPAVIKVSVFRLLLDLRFKPRSHWSEQKVRVLAFHSDAVHRQVLFHKPHKIRSGNSHRNFWPTQPPGFLGSASSRFSACFSVAWHFVKESLLLSRNVSNFMHRHVGFPCWVQLWVRHLLEVKTFSCH